MLRCTTLSLAIALGGFAIPAVAASPVTVRVQDPLFEPNGTAATPAVSADGTVVAFSSVASNLVSDPTTGALFVHDLVSGSIEALMPYGAAVTPAISANGRFVAFTTDANALAPGLDSSFNDVLRVDRMTGLFDRATRGFGGLAANAPSETPAISGDGRFVAFSSLASNLVAPSTTPNRRHIYVADMDNGFVELVTRSPDFAEGDRDALALEANAMSSDGRRLVFTSSAENIAPVFAGNVSDVFVRTRDPSSGQSTYEMVNRSEAGTVGSQSSNRGSISPNGRYVAFRSGAQDIVVNHSSDSDIFVRDLEAGTLRAVPLPAGLNACNRARVTDHGDVLMQCAPVGPATALQVFLAPAAGGAPRLMSFARQGGGVGNASSGQSFTMSADGALVAIESAATDLVEADTNVLNDVFLVADPRVFDGLFGDGFE